MLQTILFDLDNTLVDRKTSLQKYMNPFMEKFSEALQWTNGQALFEIVERVDGNGHITRDAFFQHLLQSLPWREAPDVEQLRAHWFHHFPKYSQPMPFVHPTLQCLKSCGIQLGIVTNGKTKVQNEKIDVLGIRSLMGGIFISESLGIKKPDERIFRSALQSLNAHASNTWFVGDHPLKDIGGAAAVGLTTVWVCHGQAWCEKSLAPNYQIHPMDELLQIIQAQL